MREKEKEGGVVEGEGGREGKGRRERERRGRNCRGWGKTSHICEALSVAALVFTVFSCDQKKTVREIRADIT